MNKIIVSLVSGTTCATMLSSCTIEVPPPGCMVGGRPPVFAGPPPGYYPQYFRPGMNGGCPPPYPPQMRTQYSRGPQSYVAGFMPGSWEEYKYRRSQGWHP